MVNLAAHAEVLELLAEVEAVAADLTPNELEMLSHLKSKYAMARRCRVRWRSVESA